MTLTGCVASSEPSADIDAVLVAEAACSLAEARAQVIADSPELAPAEAVSARVELWSGLATDLAAAPVPENDDLERSLEDLRSAATAVSAEVSAVADRVLSEDDTIAFGDPAFDRIAGALGSVADSGRDLGVGPCGSRDAPDVFAGRIRPVFEAAGVPLDEDAIGCISAAVSGRLTVLEADVLAGPGAPSGIPDSVFEESVAGCVDDATRAEIAASGLLDT